MKGGTLALDYGRKRIGVAVSDPMGITVQGRETQEGGPTPEAAGERLATLVVAMEPATVLVGLPLHADGGASELSAEARRFGEALAQHAGCRVVFVDETLTSWEAEQALKARGIDLQRARREGLIDQEAACGLLRGWLRDQAF